MANSSSSSSSGLVDVWDAEKMLDLYLHDYMVKKNMHSTAAIFKREAGVFSDRPVVIDTKEGFLNEWWRLFYDMYSAGMLWRPQHDNVEEYRSNAGSENIAQIQVQDNRNLITFGRSNNIGANVFGPRNSLLSPSGSPYAGIGGVKPGQQMGRPSKPPQVVSTALRAPNPQQLVQALTAEQQPPPLADQQKVVPPLRPIVKPQKQPDQQQQQQQQQQQKQQQQPEQQQQLPEDGRERRIASGAGDNHLENMNANEEVSVEENTESFLSYEDDSTAGGTSPAFKASKRHGGNRKHRKGFSFKEICSLHSSMAKVVCCHFSSNGALLASAGHEKKVLIWNMETFDVVKTLEEHSHLITDVRFRPNSTMFATSSYDRIVKIWDAARPSESISKLEGHTEQVMSIDFHPRKFNLLSSCDSNDEIRLWNVTQSTCTRTFKGATKQVRFQPRFGKYLAAASGNSINTFDVETANFDLDSKGSGHANEILSICWDATGKYLASVSEDSARIWSTASSGKCIYELHSNGNKFQSCTFHPGYSLLLIIGCYETLELWSPSESSKTMTVPAHKGLVAALAASPKTDMVASGSHDQIVKLWK